MKKKKINFRKDVIADLSVTELSNIKGGNTYGLYSCNCMSINCDITYNNACASKGCARPTENTCAASGGSGSMDNQCDVNILSGCYTGGASAYNICGPDDDF